MPKPPAKSGSRLRHSHTHAVRNASGPPEADAVAASAWRSCSSMKRTPEPNRERLCAPPKLSLSHEAMTIASAPRAASESTLFDGSCSREGGSHCSTCALAGEARAVERVLPALGPRAGSEPLLASAEGGATVRDGGRALIAAEGMPVVYAAKVGSARAQRDPDAEAKRLPSDARVIGTRDFRPQVCR